MKRLLLVAVLACSLAPAAQAGPRDCVSRGAYRRLEIPMPIEQAHRIVRVEPYFVYEPVHRESYRTCWDKSAHVELLFSNGDDSQLMDKRFVDHQE